MSRPAWVMARWMGTARPAPTTATAPAAEGPATAGVAAATAAPRYGWVRVALLQGPGGMALPAAWPLPGGAAGPGAGVPAGANALAELHTVPGGGVAASGVAPGGVGPGQWVRVWLLDRPPLLAEPPLPVVLVVGPHNAGKTLLVERLVPALATMGWPAAAIKHAPHGFDLDHPGKDSWRLGRAGAQPVALIGPAGARAMVWQSDPTTGDRQALDELAAILALMRPAARLVLAEGFKGVPGLPRVQLGPGDMRAPAASPAGDSGDGDGTVLAAVGPLPFREADVGSVAQRVAGWCASWYERLAARAGAGPPGLAPG